MEQDIPVFGARNESLPQKTRACAYAVATTPDGLVAAVHESHGLHLPGGGMELSESPIETIHREVREELVSNSHEHQLEWVCPDNLFHAHHAWAARKRLASLLQSTPHP
jgi:ADP-ribose pyrophosphatase YjhB (NUDIX family)